MADEIDLALIDWFLTLSPWDRLRRAPTGRGSRLCGVSKPRPTDPLALLDALNAAGVEYVVIGGAAAVLHGAPVTTQDLDIVHRLTPENAARLERVLRAIHATIREPGSRRIETDAALCVPAGVR
jgi:hypothetical protein